MAVFQGTVEQIENNTNKVSAITEASEEQYPNCKAIIDYVDKTIKSIPEWVGGSY